MQPLYVHRGKNSNAIEAVKKVDFSRRKKTKESILDIPRQKKKKTLTSVKNYSIEIRCATKDWRTPVNGVKKPYKCRDGQTVKVNTICRVECNFGYELQGTSKAECTPRGNWNPGSSPRCAGRYYCACAVMVKLTSWRLLKLHGF